MGALYRTIAITYTIPYTIPYTAIYTYCMTGACSHHKRHVSAESQVLVCTFVMQIYDLEME